MFQVARPFHETIVEAIGRASSRELECLIALIKATEIPSAHHYKIIAALDKRRRDLFWDPRRDHGVRESLLMQKESAKSSGEGIKLDDLQQEVEKLLALLKDRQPGLFGLNDFMLERLQNLHKIISQALER